MKLPQYRILSRGLKCALLLTGVVPGEQAAVATAGTAVAAVAGDGTGVTADEGDGNQGDEHGETQTKNALHQKPPGRDNER